MEDSPSSTLTPSGLRDRANRTEASALHNNCRTAPESSTTFQATQEVEAACESTAKNREFCPECELRPVPVQKVNVTASKDSSEDTSTKNSDIQATGTSHDAESTMLGADEPESGIALVEVGLSSEPDNVQSKTPVTSLVQDKLRQSGVMPRLNDTNQDLFVDEEKFRSLALSPYSRDEDLEDDNPSDNISSSPIDIISFSAPSDTALSTGTDALSPGRKKNRGDNYSASSANAAETALRRRDRCYFTIVVPKATHGQAEEMELSDMGEDELNDEDRKQMMREGEDFSPNSVENGSSTNPQSLRSGCGTDDPSLAPFMASADSKFEVYAVVVDRRQDDKASEIALCSMERPHMRGFHFAWMAMFISFLMWFAITPLLGEIQISLNLTREEIWTSSVFGTTGTIVMRVIMGPLCDKYGSRLCMSLVVLTAAIPCALTGLVNTANGLYISRLCVGIAGASFVTCEYWTSSLFIKEIAGTANSLVSGWGNLGGGELLFCLDLHHLSFHLLLAHIC
jgi:hypothetical protein